jgi:Flp pilus assembly protein TadG
MSRRDATLAGLPMMLMVAVYSTFHRLSLAKLGGENLMAERRLGSRSFRQDRRGSTAIEFAVISPVLILMLLGILVYGGYFMLSHSLQQMANDAARASVAGLTDTERSTLAQTAVTNDVQTYSYLSPRLLSVNYADQNQVLTVTLTYNASGSPFWALNGLVPMPSPTLVRSASVQIGGY